MSHFNFDESSDFELRSGNPGSLTTAGQAVADSTTLAIVSDPLLGQSLPSAAVGTVPRVEIVFIENNVGGIDLLREGIGAGKEVYVLDASRDGLQQIAGILAGRTGVDALHLISHGAEASVNLGSVVLDKANLSKHQEVLQRIGKSLSADADILLYGCNVGLGSGLQLIDQLAVVTGADIAASNNLTGTNTMGGDWELEVMAGRIETTTNVSTEFSTLYLDVLDVSNKTATFGTAGNFISKGGKTSSGDVSYKVNGSSNYTLQINGTTRGVIDYPKNLSYPVAWMSGCERFDVISVG